MSSNKETEDLIKKLVISFFKGSLIDHNDEDKIKQLTWNNQQDFLNATVNSTLFKKYPLNASFCSLFFKKLLKYLEIKQDVHDDIYNFLCSFMNSVNENGFCFRHYIINNNLSDVITIKETKNIVVNGTTGLKTWQAALMLSDWALCNKEIFSNKNVLELGSGVGFTAIALAKHCNIKSMVMTDCHTDVLNNINDNIQINFPDLKKNKNNDNYIYKDDKHSIGVMMLDWNNSEDIPKHMKPDIIIGADIVYDPSILRPLIDVFEIFQLNKNVEIYIASVIRNEDTFKGFLHMLVESNFKYEVIPLRENVHIEWDTSVERSLIKINKKYVMFYLFLHVIFLLITRARPGFTRVLVGIPNFFSSKKDSLCYSEINHCVAF